MDLWSEPMTGRVSAFLLASLLTLLLLIFWEVRSHRPTPEPRPSKPKAVRPPRPEPAGPGTMPRSVAVIGLMIAAFAVVALRFGVPLAATVLTLTIAILLRSLWYTGPAILAQCGARAVRDPNLIEAVAELAAKAGIAAPRILEIRGNPSERLCARHRRPRRGHRGNARLAQPADRRRAARRRRPRDVPYRAPRYRAGDPGGDPDGRGRRAGVVARRGRPHRAAPRRPRPPVPGGAGAGCGAGAAARRDARTRVSGRPRRRPAVRQSGRSDRGARQAGRRGAALRQHHRQ